MSINSLPANQQLYFRGQQTQVPIKRSMLLKGTAKETAYVSTKGNICSDGKDDGKIGIFSAVSNIVEGAGKTVVNGIKGLFTDSEGHFSLAKTLGTVAVGAACVVCPAIGVGLGALGLVSGASKIGSGVVKALNAKTDAEAKDMWEQVGEGGLTVAASVAGMKASYGAMKTAAGAESALSKLSNEGSTFHRATEFAKAFGKDAVGSTKNNIGKIRGFFNTAKELSSAKRKLQAIDKQGPVKKSIRKEVRKEYVKDAESYNNNNLTKALHGVKSSITKHLKNIFKKQDKTAIAKVGAGASKTPKAKFGKLTNAPKQLFGTSGKIWAKLSNGNTSYSKLVQEFGYENVAEALKVFSEYGVVNSQI